MNGKERTESALKKLFFCVPILLLTLFLCACGTMQRAQKEYENGNYAEAKKLFQQMKSTDQVSEWIKKCDCQIALSLMDKKEYEEAAEAFEALSAYGDDDEMVRNCRYQFASEMVEAGRFRESIPLLEKLGDYKNAAGLLKKAKWQRIYSYVEEKGEEQNWTEGRKAIGGGIKVNSLSPVVFCLYFKDPETAIIGIDGMLLDSISGSMLTQTVSGKLEVKIDAARSEIKYHDKIKYSKSGSTMNVEEDYTAHTDISTYSDLHDIYIDSFIQSGTDFAGSRIYETDPNKGVAAEQFLQLADIVLNNVETFFNEADFEFKMSDLGFMDLN